MSNNKRADLFKTIKCKNKKSKNNQADSLKRCLDHKSFCGEEGYEECLKKYLINFQVPITQKEKYQAKLQTDCKIKNRNTYNKNNKSKNSFLKILRKKSKHFIKDLYKKSIKTAVNETAENLGKKSNNCNVSKEKYIQPTDSIMNFLNPWLSYGQRIKQHAMWSKKSQLPFVGKTLDKTVIKWCDRTGIKSGICQKNNYSNESKKENKNSIATNIKFANRLSLDPNKCNTESKTIWNLVKDLLLGKGSEKEETWKKIIASSSLNNNKDKDLYKKLLDSYIEEISKKTNIIDSKDKSTLIRFLKYLKLSDDKYYRQIAKEIITDKIKGSYNNKRKGSTARRESTDQEKNFRSKNILNSRKKENSGISQMFNPTNSSSTSGGAYEKLGRIIFDNEQKGGATGFYHPKQISSTKFYTPSTGKLYKTKTLGQRELDNTNNILEKRKSENIKTSIKKFQKNVKKIKQSQNLNHEVEQERRKGYEKKVKKQLAQLTDSKAQEQAPAPEPTNEKIVDKIYKDPQKDNNDKNDKKKLNKISNLDNEDEGQDQRSEFIDKFKEYTTKRLKYALNEGYDDPDTSEKPFLKETEEIQQMKKEKFLTMKKFKWYLFYKDYAIYNPFYYIFYIPRLILGGPWYLNKHRYGRIGLRQRFIQIIIWSLIIVAFIIPRQLENKNIKLGGQYLPWGILLMGMVLSIVVFIYLISYGILSLGDIFHISTVMFVNGFILFILVGAMQILQTGSQCAGGIKLDQSGNAELLVSTIFGGVIIAVCIRGLCNFIPWVRYDWTLYYIALALAFIQNIIIHWKHPELETPITNISYILLLILSFNALYQKLRLSKHSKLTPNIDLTKFADVLKTESYIPKKIYK